MRSALLVLLLASAASPAAAQDRTLERWIDDLRLTSDASNAQRERAVKALGKLGQRAVPRLLSEVRSLHPLFCARALAAVGKPAVPALVEALGSDQDLVRTQRAAEALGEMGPSAKQAIPALTRCLSHRDMWIRIAAVDALGRLGPAARSAAPQVRRLLHDGWVRVPISAAEALWRITGDRAEPIAALRRSARDVDESIRDAALLALGRLGPDPQVIATLVDYLDDVAEPVRNTARVLLAGFGTRSVPALRRALKRSPSAVTRSGAALALSKMGARAAPAVPTLRDLFRRIKEPVRVRDAAAYALGAIGPAAKAAAPDLIRGLADGDRMVRASCAQALGRIGEAAAVVPLAGALKDREPSVRVNAAIALGRFGPRAAPAAEALNEALLDRSPTVCRWAAEALGRIGAAGRPALDHLRRLRDDEDQPEEVRRAARQAIERMSDD